MAASYPTAVKSFTTKNAGDTIQPGHINDLQDEVAAIEGGILNGTAPLNSSNSTVANLVVSGVSTFAGNVTINSTLTVTHIVSTSLTPGAKSYVRAYAGSPAQTATASTGTKLALDQEVIDLLGEWDSTTYTFTPQSSGYYLVTGRALPLTASAGIIYFQLHVNDTIAAQVAVWEGAGESQITPAICATLNLSSGTAGSLQFRAVAPGSTARMSSGLENTSLEILKIF